MASRNKKSSIIVDIFCVVFILLVIAGCVYHFAIAKEETQAVDKKATDNGKKIVAISGDLDDTKNKLEVQINEFGNKYVEVNGKIYEIKDNINELTKKNNELQVKVNEFGQKFVEINGAIYLLDSKTDGIDTRLTTLESQVATIKSELAFLGDKVNTTIDDDGNINITFDGLTKEEFDSSLEVINDKISALEKADEQIYCFYNMSGHDKDTGMVYKFDSLSASLIISDIGYSQSVIVPEKYMGVRVGALDNNACLNRTTLESIVLPDTFGGFGNNCFSGCTNLRRLELPHFFEQIDISSACIPETCEVVYRPAQEPAELAE